MNKIHNILGVSKHQYDLYLFNQYFLWCDLNAIIPEDVQKYMSSNNLHKWWCIEFNILEAEFLKMAQPYIEASQTEELRVLHTEMTIKIRDYHPKILLNEIRKTTTKRDYRRTHKENQICLN